MSKAFPSEKCCNFDDFGQKVQHLLGPYEERHNKPDKWIFRGQRDANWCLASTLERACERFGVKGDERASIELKMIREFQRRLHHYTSEVPDKNSLDEWMALMRHYGAPSRLLDFNYSPYVAAYFAFRHAVKKDTVAIWAINTDWCEREFISQFSSFFVEYQLYERCRAPQSFKSIFIYDRKLVLSINPFRLNERLAAQRGVFLCPGSVSVGFMDNLYAFIGLQTRKEYLKDKIIKFTILGDDKGKTRDDALERLDDMNINGISLFPGLDGFAQSFESRIPFFRKQRDWY